MNTLTRRSALSLAALSGLGLAAPRALAQGGEWPSRPVTMIVPFPAGGSNDLVARAVSRRLSEELKQPFVVDNRSGATGNIGAQALTNAAPDGYTLMMTTSGPGATNKLLYSALPYDPEKDFTPVVLVADTPLVIAANPRQPYKTLPELIAYAKANPDKLNFGTPGNGSMGHMAAVLLQFQQGIKLNHVPYRGTGPLTSDLLAGTIDLSFDFVPTYIPHFQAGAMRGIAVTSAQRLSAIQAVATTAEQGLPDYQPKSWFGLVGPAKTPPAIVSRLNAVVNAYVASEEGKALLAGIGAPPRGGSPEELGQTITGEIRRWGPIVKEASISLD